MKLQSRYVWIILLFMLVACKTTKHNTQKESNKPTNKEVAKLSKKLNLDVSKKDNIELYAFVADWLGVPHKDGGCEKTGTDCSCFVRRAYERAYQKNLPRNSSEMFKQTQRIDTTELKEGDLVFFKIKSSRISHVGIYLKDQWFAHVSSSKGVMINSLDEKYYRTYFAGAGRVQ